METGTRSYGKFWALLKAMPGACDDPDLKARLVWRFTEGRTGSLREMTAREYARMTDWMEGETGGVAGRKRPGYYTEDAELWRRRAMAAVFGFFAKIRKPVDTAYVKAVICRAAGGARDVNEVTPSRMRDVYYSFVRRQRVQEETDGVIREELEREGLAD